jgi:hypothetical protein
MEVKIQVVPKRELPPLYYRAVLHGGPAEEMCGAFLLLFKRLYGSIISQASQQ